MSSRSLTWRRIGVGAVAVATVAAGMPLLLSSAASAADGPATRLEISRVNQPFTAENESTRTTAAAGTCTPYEVRATDAVGGTAQPATVTVVIAEDPVGGTHDVDFCLVDGGTAFLNAPQYESQSNPSTADSGDFTNEYNAGPSITTDAAESGAPPAGSDQADPNEPDLAASSSATNTGANRNNPTGEDRASFSTVNGVIRFGIAGLLPNAGATIDAFVDDNANLDRDCDPLDPSDCEDEVVASQKKLSFTTGGRPGTNAASDAVRSVEILNKSSFASVGQPHLFRALYRNLTGDIVGGVSFARVIATAGPNSPTSTSAGSFNSSCEPSGNEGEAGVCSYAAQVAGTDTVTLFVNQTTAGGNASPTFGLDANEPRDTATATTTAAPVSASEARTLALTPESASLTSGGGQQFVATVTAADGAPANGVSVTFTETGPGMLRGGTVNGTSSSVTFVTGQPATSTSGAGPAGPGRALAFFETVAGETGSNVVIATITNPGSTQCQSTTAPAGQCTDSSPVTITAAASPSPSATTSPSATPTVTTSPSPSATTPTTQAGTRYRGLDSPVRVLDTRLNNGVRRNGAIVLDLSGQIPDANATSAVLNVTVTNATARGFLVAYPNGTNKPGTSNVNFEANQTQANEVVVRMSSDKRVTLFVDSASAHVIADLVGSFTSTASNETGRVVTNAPDRAFDSRNTATPTRSGEVIVNLSDQLPAGATGAVLNVTVTRTSARGFVTVYPTGTTRPGTSNVNFERGQTQANEVITQVGTGSNAGRVSFFVDSASASLIVDVVGAIAGGTGQTFTALSSPQRALDTRANRGARRTGAFDLTMPSTVPANATGVILNVTATNGTRPGFVTVYPGGTANPGTSNVNFPTNLTQANEVTSGLGDNNRVTLFVGGANSPAAHVIVDVVGYLTS
jgi:hypothetical protein